MNTYNQFQQPKNPLKDIKIFFKGGSILSRLILINIAIWAILSVLGIFAFLFNVERGVFDSYVVDYFALPASFDALIT